MTDPHRFHGARGPLLLGQTVVLVGGSAGIGLETARQARVEGAESYSSAVTRLDSSRLLRRSRAKYGAFDASDPERLRQFFEELRIRRPRLGHRRAITTPAGRLGFR